MSDTTFLTAAELSRRTGIPSGRILAAVEAGHLIPAARAGQFKNSPILFLEADASRIKAALEEGSTTSPTTHHLCRSAEEVRQKHAAIARAMKEATA